MALRKNARPAPRATDPDENVAAASDYIQDACLKLAKAGNTLAARIKDVTEHYAYENDELARALDAEKSAHIETRTKLEAQLRDTEARYKHALAKQSRALAELTEAESIARS